jgi:hypothetical protein
MCCQQHLLTTVSGMSSAVGKTFVHLVTINLNQLRNYPTCEMPALLMTACYVQGVFDFEKKIIQLSFL